MQKYIHNMYDDSKFYKEKWDRMKRIRRVGEYLTQVVREVFIDKVMSEQRQELSESLNLVDI